MCREYYERIKKLEDEKYDLEKQKEDMENTVKDPEFYSFQTLKLWFISDWNDQHWSQ